MNEQGKRDAELRKSWFESVGVEKQGWQGGFHSGMRVFLPGGKTVDIKGLVRGDLPSRIKWLDPGRVVVGHPSPLLGCDSVGYDPSNGILYASFKMRPKSSLSDETAVENKQAYDSLLQKGKQLKEEKVKKAREAQAAVVTKIRDKSVPRLPDELT